MDTKLPVYRVIHEEQGKTRDLGRLVGVAAHSSSLDPFVSALLREGRGGRLALIDEASGKTLARRAVAPGRRHPAPPPRPSRRGERRRPER